MPERLWQIVNTLILVAVPWLTVHLLTFNAWLALAWLFWLGVPFAAVYLAWSQWTSTSEALFRRVSCVLLGGFLVLFGLWLDFRTLGFFTYVRMCQTLFTDAQWLMPQTNWQVWQFKPWTLVMMAVMSFMVVGHHRSFVQWCTLSVWYWAFMLLVMGLVERAVIQSWPAALDSRLEAVLLSAMVLAMVLALPLLAWLQQGLRGWILLRLGQHFNLRWPGFWRSGSRSHGWHR